MAPARTSPVLVKKIRHLRRQGHQLGEIAREVGVGRGTVAKYVGKVDAQAELEDAAGEFTAAQRAALTRLVELPMEQVELLVSEVRTHQCDCGVNIAYLTSTILVHCHVCGDRYATAPPAKTAKQSPVPSGRRAVLVSR